MIVVGTTTEKAVADYVAFLNEIENKLTPDVRDAMREAWAKFTKVTAWVKYPCVENNKQL